MAFFHRLSRPIKSKKQVTFNGHLVSNSCFATKKKILSLEENDLVSVFDPQDESIIIWSGYISPKTKIDLDLWNKWCDNNYPAQLSRLI